MFDQLQQVLF